MKQLNKYLKLTSIFLLLAGISTASQAQNYIGVGIGQSTYDYNDLDFEDDKDSAAALFIGRDFSESWSGEIYYHDLGTGDFTATTELDATASGLSLIYALPNNTDTWSVYGRLGAAQLTYSTNLEDETRIGYGLGLRWNMHEKWFSRLEYRGYGSETSAIFLTAAYKFGGANSRVKEAKAPSQKQVADKMAATKADAAMAEKEAMLKKAMLKDSDGDGVKDLEDKCPGSSAGSKIDANGCPVKITTEAKKAILEKIDLKSVNFKSNSDELTASSQSYLDTAATALKANSSISLEVQAYTDSGGSDAYNLALSEKRAQSVKKYLEDKGINASRLQAKGYGEANPVADNSTSEGRAKNRRVEFKVID